MWGIKTDLSPWQRSTVVFVLIGGIGVLCAQAFRYVDKKRQLKESHKTSEPLLPEVTKQPSIRAVLVIDSVTHDNIAFHVDLENGPTFPLKDILFRMQTPDETRVEAQSAMPRELLPAEKLSLASGPLALKPRDYNSVTLVTFYTATVEGLEKRFSCTYKFLFGLEQAKTHQFIDPEAIKRGDENIIERQQDIKSTTLGGITKPAGTIMFVVPEVKDGHPNMTSFGNENRQFLFDPVARIVLFRTKIKSGKIVAFSQQLRPTENGTHIITIVWDDSKGGALAVDGIEKRNMSDN